MDVAFEITKDQDTTGSYTDYVSDLQKTIKEAFDKVHIIAEKSREKQKFNYDLKAQAAKLAVGDIVLIKILAHDGKHKLADKWSEDIYTVTEQPNSDIPVYKVKREDGEGIEKTLHRNHLLHIGYTLSDNMKDKEVPQMNHGSIEDKQIEDIPVPKPRKKAPIPKPRKLQKVKETVTGPYRNFVSISDDEEDEIVVSKTTVSNPNHHIMDEEVGASLAAAPLAAHSFKDGMSTHEKVDPMEDGDAHFPDQQVTDISEGDGFVLKLLLQTTQL